MQNELYYNFNSVVCNKVWNLLIITSMFTFTMGNSALKLDSNSLLLIFCSYIRNAGAVEGANNLQLYCYFDFVKLPHSTDLEFANSLTLHPCKLWQLTLLVSVHITVSKVSLVLCCIKSCLLFFVAVGYNWDISVFYHFR